MEKNKVAPDVFLASCVLKFAHEIGDTRGVTYAEMLKFIGKFDNFRGLNVNVLRAICDKTMLKLEDYDILKHEWHKINGDYVAVYSIRDEMKGLVEKHYASMLETISDSLQYDTKIFLQKQLLNKNCEFDIYSSYRNLDQIIDAERFLLIKECDREENYLKFKYEITPIGHDCLETMHKLKEKRSKNNFEPLYFGD